MAFTVAKKLEMMYVLQQRTEILGRVTTKFCMGSRPCFIKFKIQEMKQYVLYEPVWVSI